MVRSFAGQHHRQWVDVTPVRLAYLLIHVVLTNFWLWIAQMDMFTAYERQGQPDIHQTDVFLLD